MKKYLSTVIAIAVSSTALADSGLKPGLWEMRILKNVVDGHDTSAQMAGMNTKMNDAMARLTPEQRSQMGAMQMGAMQMGSMPKSGGAGIQLGEGGAIRMCITPEMAKRDAPPVSRDSSCQPSNVHRSGNTMSYEISCTSHGSQTTGKGEATLTGDTVTTRSDTTTVERGETHRIQSESEMRFVKSDCGDVKPSGGAARH